MSRWSDGSRFMRALAGSRSASAVRRAAAWTRRAGSSSRVLRSRNRPASGGSATAHSRFLAGARSRFLAVGALLASAGAGAATVDAARRGPTPRMVGAFLLAAGAVVLLPALAGVTVDLLILPALAALLLGALLARWGGGLLSAGRGSLLLRVLWRAAPPPEAARPAGAGHRLWPWALAGAAVVLGPLLRATPIAPLLGLAFLLAVAALLVARWGRGDRAVHLLLVSALGLRVALLAADSVLSLFPKADAIGYHVAAATLADAWWHGEPWRLEVSGNVAAYTHVMAPLYLFFGSSMLLPRLANAVIGVAVAHNVYRIGTRFLDRRGALAGAALFALLPSVAQLQGEHLRDALVLLLVTSAFRLLVSESLRTVPALVFAALAAAGVFLLREPTVAVLALPLVILGVRRLGYPLSEAQPAPPARASRWGAAALLGLLAAAVVTNLNVAGWLEPERIEGIRDAWAEGGSAYLAGVSFETWWDVVVFLPIGAAAFLLSPFPWQVHNLLALLAAVENLLVFYPACLLAALAAWRSRRPEVLALALYVAIGAALYGLIEGNVGTALRHRMQFTWAILLLAGPALARSIAWTESLARMLPRPNVWRSTP